MVLRKRLVRALTELVEGVRYSKVVLEVLQYFDSDVQRVINLVDQLRP